ncbi:universal stress protein [soil metagenome]
MYRKILVAVDNSKADKSLVPHVAALAKLLGSEIILIHVADGWAARNFDQLKLAESEEMKEDQSYLTRTVTELKKQGLKASSILARGNPPEEILKMAEKEGCDLIAMTSHGHRLIGDLIHGSTIEKVRHLSHTPLLILRAADLGPADEA